MRGVGAVHLFLEVVPDLRLVFHSVLIDRLRQERFSLCVLLVVDELMRKGGRNVVDRGDDPGVSGSLARGGEFRYKGKHA